jgi:exopolysaccharide biosynthesis polyprenyl glycosylphosphotransferase
MIFWQISRFVDLGLVALSFVAAYFLKKHLPFAGAGLSTGPNYYLLLLLMLISCNYSFKFLEFYQGNQESLLRLFCRQLKGVALAMVVFIVVVYTLHVQELSRLFLALFAGMVLGFLFLKCWLVYKANVRFSGYGSRNILVIGSRARALDTIDTILAAPGQPYKIIGCLETDVADLGKEVRGLVKVIGTLADFRGILYSRSVDEVIFALPLKKIANAGQLLKIAEEIGVNVRIMPDWQIQQIMYQSATASIAFEQFLGLPTLSFSSTPRQTAHLFVKDLVDYVGAALGLLLLSPVMLLIAGLVRLSSPGPVIFGQERTGLNGRVFRFYKFRSMVANAEELRADLAEANEQEGPVFKIRNDPRVTPIGRILRKTSLDELPQLFNVLKGDMSLVGPRPPLPAEVAQYEAWQRRRLSMKPGLTCIWQVSGRNNISFEQWMKLDLEYIDRWSLLLDMKLLFMTFRAVLFTSGH